MELIIENETSVKDIQTKFNALYPFLHIDFFIPGGYENRNGRKPAGRTALLPIIQLGMFNYPAIVPVHKKVTVDELLKSFRQIGLHAQVCRKSGNHWVETSLTADWTLERQNSEAMLISSPDAKNC